MSSCVQQQGESIAFDADKLRAMSRKIYNQIFRDKYDRLQQITRIESPRKQYDVAIEIYLSELTVYLMYHWNNNELFFIWADFRMHGWKETLPKVLQSKSMFHKVEEKFQADPRRQCVR